MFNKAERDRIKMGPKKHELTAKEKSGVFGQFAKNDEVFYYDKYGNKKHDE